MSTVSIRDLANNASRIIQGVNETGRPTVVTNRGRPVAAVIAIDEHELEDFVLTNAPEYARGRADADAELAAGTTRSLTAVLAELDDEA